jgi:hypothetical protein
MSQEDKAMEINPSDEEPSPEEQQRAKRKRAVAEIDFDKIAKEPEEGEIQEEGESEEPPTKRARKYGDPKLEEHLNKLQACEMLVRYKIAFPEIYEQVCKGKSPYDFEEDEANTAVASIRFIQGCKSSGKVNEWLGSIGLGAVEDTLCYFTPLKLQGLSKLSMDPDFQDLWKEVSLDAMSLIYIDPKARMGAYLLKNAYLLHHINSAKEEQAMLQLSRDIRAAQKEKADLATEPSVEKTDKVQKEKEKSQ